MIMVEFFLKVIDRALMRVLHIFAELKFSGAEIMYVAAARTFQDFGCELFVVNTQNRIGEYAPYFEKAGYTVLHWPYENLSFFEKIAYWKRVKRYICNQQIDIVHVHRHDMKCSMAFCAWKAGVPSVYTFHNVFQSPRLTYPYHVLLRLSAKYLFRQKHHSISDSVYDNELKRFHNNTVKIYNWYDPAKFYSSTKEEKQRIRQELGIQNNCLVIISVGGCSHIKRHEDVIKALKIVQGKYEDCVYLHLGEGSTTNEEVEITKMLGLTNNVIFEGNQDNVRKYLVASDIYVMPSKFEGISLTTIEAMACGIPAILYNVPGLKDFNKSKKCSILIEEDPQKLADSIISLYHDKSKQKDLAENALSLVNHEYSMSNNVAKIYALYESLLPR